MEKIKNKIDYHKSKLSQLIQHLNNSNEYDEEKLIKEK